jgi:hypothetical protein
MVPVIVIVEVERLSLPVVAIATEAPFGFAFVSVKYIGAGDKVYATL